MTSKNTLNNVHRLRINTHIQYYPCYFCFVHVVITPILIYSNVVIKQFSFVRYKKNSSSCLSKQ